MDTTTTTTAYVCHHCSDVYPAWEMAQTFILCLWCIIESQEANTAARDDTAPTIQEEYAHAKPISISI